MYGTHRILHSIRSIRYMTNTIHTNTNKRSISQMTATSNHNDITLKQSNHSKLILQVKKLSENATIPTRGSSGAAGYDLSSAIDTVVKSKNKLLVPTDISIALPTGVYGRVAPRSGLAHKNFIDVGAGVIDEDYRGPVGVILFNFGENDFVIKKGDRIAQLILEKIAIADVVEVDQLDETYVIYIYIYIYIDI